MRSRLAGGLDLFRIGGVEVSIDYSWIFIFLLVLWSLAAGYFPEEYPGYARHSYWIVGLAATLLFFASVLIHELAHAWMGNHLGERVDRITLFIFGGMAHLSGEPDNPRTEFEVAGVGPLTSLLLGGIFWAIAQAIPGAAGHGPLWEAVFRYLAYINVALALFNLLPGFPLDGGRLLRAFFWWRSGNLQSATHRAADWGQGIAISLIVLGAIEIFSGALVGGLWLIFIGLFLRSAALESYHHVMIELVLGKALVRDVMVSDPITMPPELTIGEAVEKYFLRYGHGGFPVVADGQVLGLVSLAQVRQCPPEERSVRRVRDVMRPIAPALEISPIASVSEALRRMAESESGRLLVMDGSRLTGLVTQSGIARFVQLRSQLVLPATSRDSMKA